MSHVTLAVRHFGTQAQMGDNISATVSDILNEYGIREDDTPVTTDHGSSVLAALRNTVRLDCICHRLHIWLGSAWKETQNEEPEAAKYEIAINELCHFAKQTTGSRYIKYCSLNYILATMTSDNIT